MKLDGSSNGLLAEVIIVPRKICLKKGVRSVERESRLTLVLVSNAFDIKSSSSIRIEICSGASDLGNCLNARGDEDQDERQEH